MFGEGAALRFSPCHIRRARIPRLHSHGNRACGGTTRRRYGPNGLELSQGYPRMKLLRTLVVLIPAVFALSGPVAADDQDKIMAAFPELSAESISPSPIPGLYQVMMNGQVSYVTGDGRYLIQGDVFDVAEERNLTEEIRGKARSAAIEAVTADQMIVFGPENAEHTVTVFTDIDCGYCRKLHREIADYNDSGIAVRYLFFPRSGPNTASWSKAENVWCSGDRNDAMTKAKAGLPVESEECSPTPVRQHYQLGRSIGIRGTPAIIVEDGEMIPGYVPADDLLGYLEK